MRSALDITLASVALLLLAPLLALVAIAIRIETHGHVLFRQTRVGRNGEHFLILKFRTMVDGSERLNTSITTSFDSRITKVGRFLRRTKLDEVPQLVNVLRGEMSLVGPRPDVPEVVATYDPEMLRILEVLPGITSVASLDLTDEESLLALSPDPATFYLQTVVPAKVALAMRHVDDQSVRIYLTVIGATAAKLCRRAFGDAQEGELTRELRAVLIGAVEPADGPIDLPQGATSLGRTAQNNQART